MKRWPHELRKLGILDLLGSGHGWAGVCGVLVGQGMEGRTMSPYPSWFPLYCAFWLFVFVFALFLLEGWL